MKGYYITRSDGKRNGLSSYYGSQMRGGISQAKSDRNEAYLDPSHPLHENIKMSMTQSTHNRPPMDLIYVATLFPPEEIKPNLMETHLGLEPVQSEEGSNHGLVEEYGGSCCGDKGQFSIRVTHLTRTVNPSEIYIRTIGRLVDPMACMEKKIILCDSTSTKEMGEGFMMVSTLHFLFLYVFGPVQQIICCISNFRFTCKDTIGSTIATVTLSP